MRCASQVEFSEGELLSSIRVDVPCPLVSCVEVLDLRHSTVLRETNAKRRKKRCWNIASNGIY
jgi:hypothetical protein